MFARNEDLNITYALRKVRESKSCGKIGNV